MSDQEQNRRMMFSLKDQVASLLCLHFEISHEHARLMHAEQVIMLFERDHFPIRKADGGNNHHSNLMFRWKRDHREKTAKVDAPDMAKERKIQLAQAVHVAKMNWGTSQPRAEAPRKRRWPSSKIQSR